MGTYKFETVSTRVHFDILSNVPIWHPRAHDTNRKQTLRNPDDGERVQMRIELAFFDHTAVQLVRNELSTPPIERNDRHTRSTFLSSGKYPPRTTLMHTDSP